MPRVVPSQVVALIDDLFPWAEKQADTPGTHETVGPVDSPKVSAILELFDGVPQELIRLAGREYTDLAVGMGAIKDAVERWRHIGASGQQPDLVPIVRYNSLNPVALVRRALAKCPDEAPAPATEGLLFIGDDQLRGSLRIDMSAAERAFSDCGWKAATVFAGSVIEALLLWAVEQKQQQRPADVANACAKLVREGTLTKRPHSSPERWNLHEFTEVAAELGLIKANAASLVRVAKDYRNLIHPGKAKRLAQVSNKAKALAALAAVATVVDDLSRVP